MTPSAETGRLKLRGEGLTLDDLHEIAHHQVEVALSDEAIEGMERSHEVILKVLEQDEPIYGVNTGFGKFSEVRVSREQLAELQLNLVRSHACGTGPKLPAEIVRIILIIKANSLAKGYSGCRQEVASKLIELYNADIIPLVPAHGSVGASGDLAPLSHVALALIGEGEVLFQGVETSNAEALADAGIEPLVLGPKEGLSVINGTQVSTALTVVTWLRLNELSQIADIACSWSLEGIAGIQDPFDSRIHDVRGHNGAKISAANIRETVKGSEILASDEAKRRVQDPYSIRCAPQVHGAVRDVLARTRPVLETEINGVSDNPLVFPDSGAVLSGDNFHAEPIAFAADHLAIAAAELASISERRTFLLSDPNISGLPTFLTDNGGLHSGFMMYQCTQASLVSANKTLTHPASVDSIPTSAGWEDHVSMATWAGYKALEVTDRVATVLAIEILVAAQAVDLRKPLRPSVKISQYQESLRQVVQCMKFDRAAYRDVETAREWLVTTLSGNWI